MSDIYVGSARIDEKGNATGGKKGDQKQTSLIDITGEVSMQKMYTHSKGWYIIRAKDSQLASRLAYLMGVACNNKHIGYNQNERTGIYTHGINTRVDTNCDCSSLVRQCVIEATGAKVNDFTTSNEWKVLKATGLFEERIAYLSQSATPVYDGDILVTKTKGHTVIVVSGSPRVIQASGYYKAYTGSSTRLDDALRKIGAPYGNVTKRKALALKNGFANYSGKASENIALLALAKAGKLKKV